MAYYETVMIKGYQTLVDEDTVVSVDQGAYAAKQLHQLTRARMPGWREWHKCTCR